MNLRSLFLALILATGLIVPASAAAAPERAGAAQQRAERIAWRDCRDGFQCATLAVPRDWDRPRTRGRIRLALIRVPATRRPALGSLLVNFGGPGASGVTSMRGSGKLIRRATGGRFHVVSWDPRGVGASAPIKCPEGNDAYFEADPFTAEGLAQMGAAVAERARACSARYGSFLSDIGTDQVVQDMDAIRAAVGDRKTTFLGLSYGTRVGTVYAQRFPHRVRAMVLDGSLPPVSTATEISEGLAVSFERALNEYFERCRQRSDCPFGPQPEARFDQLVAELRAHPPEVPGTGGRRLTVGLFYQVTLALIINYGGSTQAAEAMLRDYLTSGDLSSLYAFTQIIAGDRQPDGRFLNNGPETFQFIDCLDWQDRPTVAEVGVLAERSKAIAPRLGPFGVTFALMNMTACPERAKPVPPPTSRAIPPLLVVGNDNDAETPIHSSQLLSQALPGSRLLTWQGFGHTAFTSSPCIARKAGRYLVTAKLPKVGAYCPDRPLG
jgi:pimeloyl-ACP methyl ester carboxylesterase